MSDSLPVSEVSVQIAAILRSYVGRTKVSQAALANIIGVSQGHMSNLLNGIKSFDIDELERVCIAFGTDIDAVVRDATGVTRAHGDGHLPDVPDLNVRGVVQTANLAARKTRKRNDVDPAD